MYKRRVQTLLLAVAVLLVNAVALLWLQANPTPTAWAGPPAQDAPTASDAPAALDAVDALPTSFSYQGVLRDASGELLDNVQVDLTIKLYTVVAGGTHVHSQPFTGVYVRDGLLNVAVDLPSTDIVSNDALYVGVTVEGDSELVPRQKVHPVPWALRAQHANTAGTASLAVVTFGANALLENGTAPKIAGNVDIAGNVTINGDDVVVQNHYQLGNQPMSTEPRYLNRYIVELEGTGSLALDMTIVNRYCQDVDGCTVTFGYKEPDSPHGRFILTDEDASAHFSLGPLNSNRVAWVTSAGTSGIDGDNSTDTYPFKYDACYLTENEGASDSRIGFALYNAVSGGCRIVIED